LTSHWFVYILRCTGGSYYTGSTNNIEKRFEDHINGKGARYTRSHKPERIVYKEEFASKSLALKREAELKKLSRSKKESLIGQIHIAIR